MSDVIPKNWTLYDDVVSTIMEMSDLKSLFALFNVNEKCRKHVMELPAWTKKAIFDQFFGGRSEKYLKIPCLLAPIETIARMDKDLPALYRYINSKHLIKNERGWEIRDVTPVLRAGSAALSIKMINQVKIIVSKTLSFLLLCLFNSVFLYYY